MNQFVQYRNEFNLKNESSSLSYMDSCSYSTIDQFSSAKTTRSIPKPDFSSIERKETTLEFKDPGSYKKPKITFPQTPIKSQKKTFNTTTPGNFVKELFPFDSIQGNGNHSSACRKLNFNMSNSEEEEENNTNVITEKDKQNGSKFNLGLYTLTPQFLECLEEKDESNSIFSSQTIDANGNNLTQFTSMSNALPSFNSNMFNFERSGKFECEYFILKNLSEKKGRKVYKCVNKHQKQFCVIRKEKLLSNSTYDNNTKSFIRESMKNSNSVLGRFCTKYDDSWEEKAMRSNDLSPLSSNDSLYNNRCLIVYSYEKYYQNGDLLDFLSQLETKNFRWSIDFYWDMIFEMMCGLLYLHQCGFVHFDIKPSNFYIDSNGDIKLGGLNHVYLFTNLINIFLNQNSQKLSFEDLFGRDSTYVAPEVFNRSFLSEIDFKCDVFSLGLSLLEIIGKINLPENGPLWREIRTEGFKINQAFFFNWNDYYASFAALIQRMICFDVNDRPSIMDLFNDDISFPELNERYKMLLCNAYVKCGLNDLLSNYLKKPNEEESRLMDFEEDLTTLQAKRSNSTKTFSFY